jgi:hypothetical protein
LDFNNNLLGFLLKDLESVAMSKSKHWSFSRYFDRFVCSSHVFFGIEEVVCICMFVFGMLLLERNDSALESFISSVLDASNPSIHQSWPVVLWMSLKFIGKFSLKMTNPFWLKVLQVLRSEFTSDFTSGSFILSECFTGTVIGSGCELKLFGQYDFEEDLSIERDAIIFDLGLFFASNGLFERFIRKLDGEFQLGSDLVAEFSNEKQPNSAAKLDLLPFVAKDNSQLDQDISGLQERLRELETKEQTSSKASEIDINLTRFVIDTNALISNDEVVENEIHGHSERFYLPLIVLVEIEKLKSAPGIDRKDLAARALEKLQKLMETEKIFIVNNYGRILRSQEIKQQVELLNITIGNRINDDVIIDTCRELSKSCSPIVLLTDDVNMRLKAKTRQIESISVKEFRKLFHR